MNGLFEFLFVKKLKYEKHELSAKRSHLLLLPPQQQKDLNPLRSNSTKLQNTHTDKKNSRKIILTKNFENLTKNNTIIPKTIISKTKTKNQ